MGEPVEPTRADRDELVKLAFAIVESVRNDEAMPMPVARNQAVALWPDIEQLVFRFAQLVTLYIDRLQFVSTMAMTATQTAVLRMEGALTFQQTAMREILRAARDGEFPEWWPEQRADAPVTR